MIHERFIRSFDGTTLYTSDGGNPDGPPMLLCDGLGCDGFIWKHVREAFATTHRLVHWHYRGHGLSAPPPIPDAIAVQHLIDDMRAVLDAYELDRAILLGHSMGVQLTLELALQAPERVAALVAVCGSYGRPLDTFHDNAILGTTFPWVKKLVKRYPRQAQQIWTLTLASQAAYRFALLTEVNGRLLTKADFMPYLRHIGSMDVTVFMKLLDRVREHTVEPRLEEILAPTLVVAGEKDTFTPAWLSRRMARRMPNAELLVIPSGTHVAPLEIPELLHLRLQQFLAAHGLVGAREQTPRKKTPRKKTPRKKTPRKKTPRKKSSRKKRPPDRKVRN